MKPKVYIETSVVSYLTSRPSRDLIVAGRQTITCDWWENNRDSFNFFISELVEEEMAKGDPEAAALRAEKVEGIDSLNITEDAEKLAELLMSAGTVPVGSEEDALHIAAASAHGMDYLLTWNFKHINNAQRKTAIIEEVESCGFNCPQLCSPEELGDIYNV